MEAIRNFIRNNPILTFLILAVLVYGAYVGASNYIFDWKAEKHVEKQEELKDQMTEAKIEAATSAAEGKVFREEAERGEAEITKSKSTVKDKKQNAKNIENKTTPAATRSIDDSDVPSGDELCSRANELGIRCDKPD